MKRCPECRREYDHSMMFCLDDGAELLYGPASTDATAILSEPPASADGQFGLEAATQAQIYTTDQTAVLPSGIEIPKKSFDKRLLLAPVALAAIVLGGFFGYKYFTPAKQISSIAVMPFVNESGNADVEYLSDGMTETLIKSLAQLPNLNVKARNAVFRYKGSGLSSSQIGLELNVQAIMTGRLVQRGNDLTLHVELVDVATDNSIWKESYSRQMANLVTLQTDISRDVVGKLLLRLSGADRQKLGKNYTENAEAYQAYLRGRHIWNKGTAPGYEKGRDYFQLAIEIDPAYALAYAGLADFYGFSAANGLSPPDENWPKCEAAVNKALELDATLAEAYNPHAAVKLYFYRDWPAAERAFQRGIELNPKFSEIRHHYGLRLVHLGRGDEGLAEIQRALDLDPLSVRYNLSRARLLFLMRDYDGALAQIHKTLELDPNAPMSHEWLGNIYQQKKMPQEAVAAWSKAFALRGESEKVSILERSFASGGLDPAVKALAEKEIEQLNEKSKRGEYVPAGEFMMAYTRMSDIEQALSWFAKAENDRTAFRFEVDKNPIFDSLRSDSRFQELVKKIALPK